MEQFMAFSNFLGGLPLHTLLILAIIALWRRTNKLEDELAKCMEHL